MEKLVTRLSIWVSNFSGSSWAFPIAVCIICIWLIFGPITGFSDTWQLVINTFTTLVTFMMMFLIQNTQNRDSQALHLKLDEIIRSLDEADNDMIDLENQPPEKLEEMRQRITAICDAKKAAPQ